MSKFKYILLAVAIAIVFVFFVGFGVASFYKTPKYEDFCGEREKFIDAITKQKCDELGGKWNSREVARPLERIDTNQLLCTKVSEKNDAVTLNCQTQEQIDNQGYCDRDFFCRGEFDDVREVYNRNVFIVATGIGIIALIAGFALKLASVSSGIMGGGILTIIYGTIRYWSDLPDFGRFIILGITLIILIWMGYKKISK
ncbi:MAG: hypothetical protein IH934_01990 [Nanoarchaeota archaeon]|nr:hypothetical protein [Nanoarchaeota archaeon]